MTRDTRWHGSPNFGDRRGGLTPELVVVHYTAMDSCDAALDRLCDPNAEVSSHYLISEKGDVLQLVEEDKRAWHAGGGRWRGRGDVNSRSIGIELDNTGQTPFSEPLMSALEDVLCGVLARWSIPAHAVIGHSDMAPDRKFDPGCRFDWQRLARQGLSIWPDATPSTTDFATSATRFGYDLEHGEQAVLHAFRQRFRPMATRQFFAPESPPDATDRALAADLADRFGIDATD
ncbi:MAG: N-acetylmuramoyl-L-alanine amidase [Pseudomonadota bacterium]